MQKNQPPVQLVSIDDVMSTIRVSRATVYRLIDSKRLERVKIGSKALITARSLNSLVAELLGDLETQGTA